MINFPLELYISYINRFNEVKENNKKEILSLRQEHKFLSNQELNFISTILLQDKEKDKLKSIINRKKQIEEKITELFRDLITYKLYDIVINNEQKRYDGNMLDRFTENIINYLKKELEIEKFEYFEISIIKQLINVSQHIVSSTMYSPYYIKK
ncbi:hypothetical protein [Fusobacterium sp.]|uniref:hypothetical protein n=1 Tax=Fusobacterium sp. TaxID=68766 RepID=UPI00261B697B|nr:hypothetical protein [Fusobacterium sp.]